MPSFADDDVAVAKNIAAGVNLGVTIALVAIEGVKESIDYVWDTLQDERQNDMWDNMKIILSKSMRGRHPSAMEGAAPRPAHPSMLDGPSAMEGAALRPAHAAA